MRANIKKHTLGYQFRHTMLWHIASLGVSFVFQMVAFWWFLENNTWKEILSVIFILVYFGMMYRTARDYAEHDTKSYSELKPSMAKGIMFGVMISISNIIMIILLKAAWLKWGIDGSMHGIPGMIINFIFSFWMFPYYGIMGLSGGLFTWYSGILMLVVPIISTTLGYIAGIKHFNFVDTIEKFAFEKKGE